MSEQSINKEDLPDVQNQEDKRGMTLDHVGISDKLFKAGIEMKDGGVQPVDMTIKPTVDLPAENKGIHMSRMLESFYNDGQEVSLKMEDVKRLSFDRLAEQAQDVLDRQDANKASLSASFKYQIIKEAPSSGKESPSTYPTQFTVNVNDEGITDRFITVEVVGTSLCPCSKEISEYGAHNQRSNITLEVRLRDDFNSILWIEDLVDSVEDCVSEEIYSILKRVDEKAVTEGAYENPKFVEDIARDVLNKMKNGYDDKISWARVTVENEESIHHHDAYARSELDLTGEQE